MVITLLYGLLQSNRFVWFNHLVSAKLLQSLFLSHPTSKLQTAQYYYSTLANWTMASSFPMLGTLFVPDFLFGRPFGLIRTETPIDALAGNTGFEPVQT